MYRERADKISPQTSGGSSEYPSQANHSCQQLVTSLSEGRWQEQDRTK